jgi:anti-sigma-K factor RskA
MRAGIDAWHHRLVPLEDARPSVTAPPDAWAAIRDRIGLHGAPAVPTIRLRNQGVWMTLAPGVRMRLLHVEPVTGARSAILMYGRLQRGTGP